MKKLFEWKYKPSGNCPVQAEGWFLDYYFYFRARHTLATIEFYEHEEDFYKNEPVFYTELKKTRDYQAGWLSKEECKWLIYKGCLKFILGL